MITHLASNNWGCNRPVGGDGLIGVEPQGAMGLGADIINARQWRPLALINRLARAVAAEAGHAQLQVDQRNVTAGRLPLDGRPAQLKVMISGWTDGTRFIQK